MMLRMTVRRPREPRTVAMARRFMAQAEADLAAAEYLLPSPHGFAAVRQAFDAAEKALKAAHFHVLAEEPSYTHDVAALVERLEERTGPAPGAVEAAIDALVPVFERVRYPSGLVSDPIPADTIRREDAEAAIGAAGEVMVWVRQLLAQPAGRPRRNRRS
jgi:HEPN domain-containing protein